MLKNAFAHLNVNLRRKGLTNVEVRARLSVGGQGGHLSMCLDLACNFMFFQNIFNWFLTVKMLFEKKSVILRILIGKFT